MVDVVLYSPSGDKLEFTIAEPDDLTYTTVNNSKTRALTTIIDEYGQNSQNLVYASKTNLPRIEPTLSQTTGTER